MPEAMQINENPLLLVRIRQSLSRLGLLIGVIVLFILLSFIAPNFLTYRNLLNILRAMSFTGMIACSMTFVIISGDIDVSVGSATAFASSVLGVLAITHKWPLGWTVAFVLFLGVFIHAAAGLVRVKLNVPSFVVTLSMFMSLRGAGRLITSAWSITPFPESFNFWGQGSVAGVIPVPVVFMIVAFVIFFFLSKRSVYGRSVYSIGGNEEAAKLSGIPVVRTRIITYALTGFMAALSGIILSSRISAGSSKIAMGLEFEVIAAVIIGGTSLSGGRGSIFGTFLGVLFIGFLRNGMILMGIDPFAQEVASGLIILFAVLISELQKFKKR